MGRGYKEIHEVYARDPEGRLVKVPEGEIHDLDDWLNAIFGIIIVIAGVGALLWMAK